MTARRGMTIGARVAMRADALSDRLREEVADGIRPKLSARALERIGEEEFARRTHGGWTGRDCPQCGLRVPVSGACCDDPDPVPVVQSERDRLALLRHLGLA